MAEKNKKSLLTEIAVDGRVMFPVSIPLEQNFDLLDFIDKYVDKKKITRNQAIRDLLYMGKAHAIENKLDLAI